MLLLMIREVALILLSGLFARYLLPFFPGQISDPGLFWVGIFMGLSFMPIYALGVLAGNRMNGRVKLGVAALFWVLAFAPGAQVALGLPALLFAGWGAVRHSAAERVSAAAGALFAYSFPMLGIRWALLPLLGGGAGASTAAALLIAAAYVSLRSLVRILWPGSVEGDATAPPLIYRPVPDAIVGLVEAAARRSARPHYTLPDGSRTEEGVCVLAAPAEAEAVAERIRAQLGTAPFRVALGQQAGERIEVVVRPEALR